MTAVQSSATTRYKAASSTKSSRSTVERRGLPRINDGALLFLLSMIAKRNPSPEEGAKGRRSPSSSTAPRCSRAMRVRGSRKLN